MSRNTSHSNALHIATKKRHIETVKWLIEECNFPLDEIKSNGCTAMAIASFRGYKKILQLLIEGGADINMTSTLGIGPLFLAIKASKLEIVEYLLNNGAQVYYEDRIKRDYSPMFYAIREKNLPIIELFCDFGADLT